MHVRNFLLTVVVSLLGCFSSGCKPKDAELVAAIKKGDEGLAIDLLERGANPHAVDHKVYPRTDVLCLAARKGQIGVVRALLDHGASQWHEPIRCAIAANQAGTVRVLAQAGGHKGEGRSRYSPLSQAAEECNMPVIEALLEAGADVDGGDDAKVNPPLTLAAKYGHIDCVKKFLAAGARVDQRDIYGSNAVLYAAARGHLEIVKLLLEHGSDPTIPNAAGHTAAFTASWSGNEAIMTLFREKGVKNFGMRDPPTLPLSGPKIRVQAHEIQAKP